MRNIDYIFIALFILLILSSLVHGAIVRHRLEVMDAVIKECRQALNRHIQFVKTTTQEVDIRDK